MNGFESQEVKRIRCSVPLLSELSQRAYCKSAARAVQVGKCVSAAGQRLKGLWSPDQHQPWEAQMQSWANAAVRLCVKKSWTWLDKECLIEVPSIYSAPMHVSYKIAVFHAFLHCSTTKCVLRFTGCVILWFSTGLETPLGRPKNKSFCTTPMPQLWQHSWPFRILPDYFAGQKKQSSA